MSTSSYGSEDPLHLLVAKCVQSHDTKLWEELVRKLQPIFARTIYRVASNTSSAQMQEVDDLVQDSFLKLKTGFAGSMQQTVFESEAAAIAYFKVLAANTARDYFRNRGAEKRGIAQTTSVDERLNEIASISTEDPDRKLLMDRIDSLLRDDSQARTIFWLYYRQGFTAKEIAEIPAFQLGAKGVESLLRRLTIAVRQKINPPEPEGNVSRGTFS